MKSSETLTFKKIWRATSSTKVRRPPSTVNEYSTMSPSTEFIKKVMAGPYPD
uniref:Uncharacterized protein n=1 Tax=Magallana gigas TaxID=29159 RepID=K1Q9I4_MAGGI